MVGNFYQSDGCRSRLFPVLPVGPCRSVTAAGVRDVLKGICNIYPVRGVQGANGMALPVSVRGFAAAGRIGFAMSFHSRRERRNEAANVA